MNKLLLSTLLCLGLCLGCKPAVDSASEQGVNSKIKPAKPGPPYKLSLAQWSFHKQLFDGEMSNTDFIAQANKMGFEGVEFVSQFFQDKVTDFRYLDTLKESLRTNEMHAVMIMVDIAGNLGTSSDEQVRTDAVTQHKLWVDAARHIGADYVRVNAHGDGNAKDMMVACVKSLKELSLYGREAGVSILVENHGSFSSDADWLVTTLTRVGAKNVYALADFDNWCIERENGKLWGAPCTKEYDRYEGMEKILPFSRGLSLKSFDFDEKGNETKTDFERMFKLIDKADYKGYLGVEYEGDMPPIEGISKTKKLAERYF